jgi:hypothetical protein
MNLNRQTLILCAFLLVLVTPFSAIATPANPVNPKYQVTTLTDADKADILFMREEEKMARDLYTAAYKKWNIPVFWNIARSEQTHMDSVKTLVTRYNLADPVLSQAGIYTNKEIQQMYDSFLDEINTSPKAALEAAVAVEKQDIADLSDALSHTKVRDITRVFTNLKQGSANHERAFSTVLKRYQG